MTWPTRTTAIPSPFASSISRSARSRTWPTLPAGPSSSSTVAVWIESTTSSAGRSARARPRRSGRSSISATTRIAPPRPAVEQAEALGAQADLGRRLLAGRVEDPLGADDARRRRRRPGGGASTCRSRARRRARTTEPGDEPAAEDAVELADPDRQARRVGLADVGRGAVGAGRPPPRARRRARADRRGSPGRGSRRGCSRPRRRGTGPPSEGRTRRRTGRRTASGRARPPRSRRAVRATGVRASTGVSGSAAWMSRPASGSRSTTIVVPGSYLPSRRCSARTSSTMFWITRRSGRAP